MPLVKSASPAAFRKNVKMEMAAGKPQKQAVAIAYSTQRAAAGKSAPPGGASARPMKTRWGGAPFGSATWPTPTT